MQTGRRIGGEQFQATQRGGNGAADRIIEPDGLHVVIRHIGGGCPGAGGEIFAIGLLNEQGMIVIGEQQAVAQRADNRRRPRIAGRRELLDTLFDRIEAARGNRER